MQQIFFNVLFEALVDIYKLIGTLMNGGNAPDQIAILSLMMLAIVAVASLNPAFHAARMEPVEAFQFL
jgi:ABC-type lipoprotein release transport system permease subunit